MELLEDTDTQVFPSQSQVLLHKPSLSARQKDLDQGRGPGEACLERQFVSFL